MFTLTHANIPVEGDREATACGTTAAALPMDEWFAPKRQDPTCPVCLDRVS